MTRIMALAVVLTSLHAAFDSVLNAERRFVASALSSLAVPAGALFGVLVLADFWGITGLAVGVVLGFVIQGAILAPMMRQYFVGHRWSLGRDCPNVREAMKGLRLTILAILTSQINTAVGRMFASLLGEGAVSAMSLGVALIALVPGLVAVSVYKVLYPELVRLFNEGLYSGLRGLFSKNFVVVAFMTFPVTLALVIFSGPITELLFKYGRFSNTAVSQTAEVIAYLALALPGGMAGILLMYYLLVARRTGLVVKISVATIAANALLAWILLRLMGIGGIALAYSLVTLVRTIILAKITSRLLGGPIFSNLALTMTKLATAAAAATAAMYGVAQLFPEANGSGTPMKLLGAGAAIATAGAAVYLLGNFVLRNERLWLLLKTIWLPDPSPKVSLSDVGNLDRHF
jgi:putative peptidoglycan lipid II flippase